MISDSNPLVDKYLADGCMRCKYGATPLCKVNNWRNELESLRKIVLACGLTEELKWGMPCYTSGGKNILAVIAFKDYASVSFFKGALLKDTHNILHQQRVSSQSARLIKFTSRNQVDEHSEVLKAYIGEAVENEKAGKKVEFLKNPEPLPLELLKKFDDEPELKKAFFELTPGRQRGYVIYFSQPKTSETVYKRIEQYKDKILSGLGFRD